MRNLAHFCVVVGLGLVGGCTNDGIDLSGIDSGNNNNNTPDGTVNNTPDGTVNNTPDGTVNNTPDGTVNQPDAQANEPDAEVREPDASVPDADVPAPTFTQVQTMLMNNCGGCHTTNESGGLKLTDKNTAYNELVGVAVEHQSTIDDANCGDTRVVPSDAAGSVIIQRLRGTCSNQMPKGRTPLTNQQIQMVEDWIDDGARNN